jgi:uncharacterized membrane protein
MINEIFIITLFISSVCFGYFLARFLMISEEFKNLNQRADNLKDQTTQMNEEFNKALKEAKQ